MKAKKRGVSPEQKRLLSAEQEKEIQKMITDKMRDQLKFPYALWTRKAVKELIERTYGIKVAVRTMGDYLNRWGLITANIGKRVDSGCIEHSVFVSAFSRLIRTSFENHTYPYWQNVCARHGH